MPRNSNRGSRATTILRSAGSTTTAQGTAMTWTTGDFNGDGVKDLIVSGREGDVPVNVALLSRDSGFTARHVTYGALGALDSVGRPRLVTVRRVPQGSFDNVGLDAILIRLGDPGPPPGYGEVYFWNGERFVAWVGGE